MKRFLFDKFFYPAKKDASFLILIWVLLALPEITVQIVKGNFFSSLLYLFLFFGFSYTITCLIDLNKTTRLFLKPIFFFILTIYTIIDIYCLYTYRTRLTYNFIEIIASTNLEETQEYLSMYLEWHQYLIASIGFIACWVLYFIAIYYPQKFKINPKFIVPLLLFSFISIFINPTLKDEFVTWNFNFEDIADLRKYPTDPKIAQEIDSLPENIIIILGESHAKNHSELYGYDKATNPLLSHLVEKGNLFVFQNVESPATNTSMSFKYILNTYHKESSAEEKWYKSTNLLEVLKKAGYSTWWLSNQAQKGLYNNLSSGASLLCDTAIFIRELWKDIHYDGELADIEITDKNKKVAVVYHLMGQHILFNERYPENFEKFSSKEYYREGLGEKQLKNLAQYDNANLYNDYTINSIIKKFEDRDAIIFYFPDHGLDMYKTDISYCGHATQDPASQQEGIKIPFLIYLSDEYKKIRPEHTLKISNSLQNYFCTDKFIYAMMDAVGLKFSNSNVVNDNSPFY